MILRATVTEVKDNYHYTVRIPQFNKIREALGATPDSELYTAVVSTSLGINPVFKNGDIVFVSFEEGLEENPCIIGVMYNGVAEIKRSDAKFSSLDVSVNAKFSDDVTIGKVTKDNIKHLEKLTRNVQSSFETIDGKLEQYKSNIDSLITTTKAHTETLGAHGETLETHSSDITDLKKDMGDMKNHKTDTDVHIKKEERTAWNSKADKTHSHKFSDIKDGKITLTEKTHYGTELPSSGTPGQLFFKLV